MSLQIEELNNEHILNKFFNIGIKSYGYQNIINIIKDFNDHYNLNIISMGSGTGIIEYLSTLNNNINWICIDIDNNPIDFPSTSKEFIQKPFMKIDYNSCQELIKNNPSIVGNCILFLNWCLPNDSTYDYDAIIQLKPIGILSIYEIFNDISGAAGGEMFFNWTQYNTDYNLKEEYYLYADKYHADDDELMDIRIGWWQSNKLDVDDFIKKGFPCVYPGNHKSQCCIS
jgi:hypothetical protein